MNWYGDVCCGGGKRDHLADVAMVSNSRILETRGEFVVFVIFLHYYQYSCLLSSLIHSFLLLLLLQVTTDVPSRYMHVILGVVAYRCDGRCVVFFWSGGSD